MIETLLFMKNEDMAAT